MPARRDEAAFVQALPRRGLLRPLPRLRAPRVPRRDKMALCVRMRPVEEIRMRPAQVPLRRQKGAGNGRRAALGVARGRLHHRRGTCPHVGHRSAAHRKRTQPRGGMDVEPRSAGGLPHLPVLDGIGHSSHSRDRAAPQGPLPPAQEKNMALRRRAPVASMRISWRFPKRREALRWRWTASSAMRAIGRAY